MILLLHNILTNSTEKGGHVRFFLFYCVMQFCSLCTPLSARDFHAILVADSYSEDISRATKTDLQMIEREIQTIVEIGKYNLKVRLFNKAKSIAHDVLKTIKSLKAQKDDILLFYFSGHGYRTSLNEGSPWPNLDFPLENCGLDFKEIIEEIRKKRAGLSIIFADCCNWKISQRAPPVIKGQLPELTISTSKKKNYNTLFFKTKGIIAVVSASAGQPSYCTVKGSFYTRSFLRSLKKVVEGERGEVSWSAVFKGARREMEDLLRPHKLKQVPVVDMDFFH